MKDSEFNALLNLYLDHEITAADAARLEAEVQSNPERRKIYRQYCQMQKACKLLAEDFQDEKVAAAQPVAERKVIPFNAEIAARQSARTSNWYVVGAFAAAAACVAVIFVGRSRQNDAAGGLAVQPMAAVSTVKSPAASVAKGMTIAPAPEKAVAVAAVSAPANAVAPAVKTVVQTQPGLLGDQLSLAAEAQRAAALAQANAQFEWMRTLQLAPVDTGAQSGDLRFEARPTPLHTNPRTYRSTQPLDATVEMTAFRFNK